MNKIEEHNQKVFEQQIELLITYKKMNSKKDVYLTEKSLKDAMNWYKGIENNIQQLKLG